MLCLSLRGRLFWGAVELAKGVPSVDTRTEHTYRAKTSRGDL